MMRHSRQHAPTTARHLLLVIGVRRRRRRLRSLLCCAPCARPRCSSADPTYAAPSAPPLYLRRCVAADAASMIHHRMSSMSRSSFCCCCSRLITSCPHAPAMSCRNRPAKKNEEERNPTQSPPFVATALAATPRRRNKTKRAGAVLQQRAPAPSSCGSLSSPRTRPGQSTGTARTPPASAPRTAPDRATNDVIKPSVSHAVRSAGGLAVPAAGFPRINRAACGHVPSSPVRARAFPCFPITGLNGMRFSVHSWPFSSAPSSLACSGWSFTPASSTYSTNAWDPVAAAWASSPARSLSTLYALAVGTMRSCGVEGAGVRL